MSDSGPIPRTQVILVVNGGYAQEMLETARVLVGDLEVGIVQTVCHQGLVELRLRVRQQIEALTQGAADVLLLSDLFGSTPSNVCLELLEEHPNWELLTGLSLPMLLKLATCDRAAGAQELAMRLLATASACIRLGTPLLPEEATRGD